MGDFNIDYNDTSSSTMFKSNVKLFGFKQLIKKCTCITELSSTTIDLILSNAAKNIPVADIIATSLSDYVVVACIRKIIHLRYKPKTIKCRNYENYDGPTRLCEHMSNMDWQPLNQITDINKALDYLNSFLGAMFGKHAPLSERCVIGRKCEWLTICEVKSLLRKRDKLLQKLSE